MFRLVIFHLLCGSIAFGNTRPTNREFSSGAFSLQAQSDDDSGRAIAWQTDGKVVVAGRSHNGSHNDFLVIRFNPDGSLDTNFSADGSNILNTGTGDSLAHAMTIDAQGRTVLAGRMWGGSGYEMGVARFSTDGSLDTSFGTGGFQKLDFSGEELIRAVGIDSSDRIVLGGYARIDTGTVDFAVSRVLSDGTLDTSFGSAGLATFDLGAAAADFAYDLVIEPADKIVLAGVSGNDFAIARLNVNGSLDNTFSGDGLLIHDFSGNPDTAYSIVRDSVGRFYVGGRAGTGSHYNFGILRLTNAGATDGGFGTGGEVTLDLNGNQSDIIRTLALDTNGRLLAFGRTEDPAGGWNVGLSRFHTNGNLDTSFGTAGITISDIEASRQDVAFKMDYQREKIVIAGRVANSVNYDVLVARFDKNGLLASSGDLDDSFDSDGVVTVDIGTASADEAQFVGEDNLNRVVSVGQSANSFAFTRHLENGSPDSAFSGDGKQTISVGTDTVGGGLIDSNNRPLGVGATSNDFSVVRLTTAGSADNSWSGDGQQTTDVGTATTDMAYDAAEDASGRVLVVGEASNDFGVVRYLANGTLDNSFSGDGKLTTDIGTTTVDAARAVVIQPDGRIVVAGEAAGDFAIARYLDDGTLDNSFSANGRATQNLGATDIAYDVALDAQNRPVLVGGTGNSFGAIRYLTNGNLDTSFATAGIFTANLDTTETDIAYGVSIAKGGKIVIAGTSGSKHFALIRLKENGSLDYCFASQGVQLISGTNEIFNSVDLTSDGRILTAGILSNDFSIHKFWP